MEKYSLYDASGNSFVIIQKNQKEDFSKLAIKLCQKNQTDGLIVVILANQKEQDLYGIDFTWLFYNLDGSTASMCGNGTRAVALYYNQKIKNKTDINFMSDVGIIKTKVDKNVVQTTMPPSKELKKPFKIDDKIWWMVDTGVPHMVTIVENINMFDKNLSKRLRDRYNTNVNFVQIKNKTTIYVRTFERGVEDETKACGTGMVASFLWLHKQNLVEDKIIVYPKSGEEITILLKNGIIHFQGAVTFVKNI